MVDRQGATVIVRISNPDPKIIKGFKIGETYDIKFDVAKKLKRVVSEERGRDIPDKVFWKGTIESYNSSSGFCVLFVDTSRELEDRFHVDGIAEDMFGK